MIEDLKKTDEESVVIRLKRFTYSSFNTAEKKSKTITALTNMAIEQFVIFMNGV